MEAIKREVLPFPNSDEVLRSILDHASVGMSLVGMDGCVVYANRSFSAMFGYPPAECIGLRASDLVDRESVHSAETQLDQLMRGEIASYRSERRYRRKDGTFFWGLVSASTATARSSLRPIYLIVQIADIDREKAAIAALAEAESRWNFALDSARQGVWDHDLRTGRVFYSSMWKILRGFDPDEDVDPASWLSRVHPDDRDRIVALAARQDSGELSENEFEYRERRRDGSWVWILSRGRPVEWMPDGSVARIMGTDTDITHLKEIEERLAADKEWLAVTLDAIADGVIATDPTLRITLCNPAAEQLTGWSRGSAIGQPLEAVLRVCEEETLEPALDPVISALSGGSPRMTREGMMIIGAGGERRIVRECASAVRGQDGAVIGGVLVFQDTTESHEVRRSLSYAATHDALTGLYNRVAFDRELGSAISEVQGGDRQHALCFIDLDRFKRVNDTAGHVAGDEFLKLVARTMAEACRTHDHCARIGGDEFAIILRDCDLEAGRTVAANVARSVGNLSFHWAGQVYTTGASIGLVSVDPAKSSRELIAEADADCYRHKRASH